MLWYRTLLWESVWEFSFHCFSSVLNADTDAVDFTYAGASTKDFSVACLTALAKYDLVHEIRVSLFFVLRVDNCSPDAKGRVRFSG